MTTVFHAKQDIFANAAIVYDDEDGCYRCSVCAKEYQSKTQADKHLAKQNCHTLKDVFADTQAEKQLYDMYLSIAADVHKRTVMTLPKFRLSSNYDRIGKFFLFCMENGVLEPFQYAEYCLTLFGDKNPYHALNCACKFSTLKRYRTFLFLNPSMIPSERYYSENEPRLKSDMTFLCSSLEHAYVALPYLKEQRFDFNHIFVSSTPIEQVRFLSIAENLGIANVILR